MKCKPIEDLHANKTFLGFFMQCSMVKITFKWNAETADGLTCKFENMQYFISMQYDLKCHLNDFQTNRWTEMQIFKHAAF